MAKKFDLTTLELLLQRLEKENNTEMKLLVNDLIMSLMTIHNVTEHFYAILNFEQKNISN